MRMPLEFERCNPLQLLLDFQRCLARSKTSSIAYAKDMRVDRDGRKTKSCIEHDICRLAPHTRQLLQSVPIEWYLTAMSLHELHSHKHEVLGLRVEQANRSYVFPDAILAECDHLLRCVGYLKQLSCR